MQTDHLISARRPGQVIVNKKRRTCRIVDFAVPDDGRIKTEKKQKDEFLDLAKEIKKTMEDESDGDTSCHLSR